MGAMKLNVTQSAPQASLVLAITIFTILKQHLAINPALIPAILAMGSTVPIALITLPSIARDTFFLLPSL